MAIHSGKPRRPSMEPIIEFIEPNLQRVERCAVEAPSEPSRLGQIFEVVDRDLGIPLQFVAAAIDEDVELSMLSQGQLLVSAPGHDWQTGVELILRAPRYHEKRVLLIGGAPRTVRMDPEERSRVHVVWGKEAVRVERGELSYQDNRRSRKLQRQPRIREDGGVDFAHAHPLTLHLYGTNESLLFSGVVQPGSNLWITREEIESMIRLVYSDRSPAGGILLSAVSASSSLTQSATPTDGQGYFPLPELYGAAARFRMESNRVRFSPTDQQPNGIKVDRRELVVPRNLTVTSPKAIDIRVERALNRLRFIDGVTGDGVTGEAFHLTRIVLEGKEPIESVQHSQLLEDGWMEVPTGFSTAVEPPSSEVQTIIAVAGYEPLLLPNEAFPFLLDLQELVFRLTPIALNGWLTIRDLNVPIDAGTITVHSEFTNELLFVGDVSTSMDYGPFNPVGSEVRVLVRNSGPLGVARLTDLSRNEYVLEIGGNLGSLVVQGESGSLPPLVCQDEGRSSVRPSFNDGADCRFERIPAGRYVVGPHEWVLQKCTSTEDFTLLSVEVRSGETTIIQANPEWALQGDILGRVVMEPGLPPPTLIAAYSLPVGPVIPRDTCDRVWLEEDGSYRIRSGVPVPKALVAAELWGGVFRIRGVFEPGGVASLNEVVVELSRASKVAEEGVFDISYTLGEDWTDVPVHEHLRDGEVRVEVGDEPIQIYVHQSASQITLRRLGDGAQRTVKLAGDPLAFFDLDEVFRDTEPLSDE